jgi:hypothetical protein
MWAMHERQQVSSDGVILPQHESGRAEDGLKCVFSSQDKPPARLGKIEHIAKARM